MVSFVRGLILVLVSLAGIVIVVAIKHGATWALSGLSRPWLNIATAVIVLPFVLAGAFLFLLRPALLKRKHRREDARVGQRAIGHRAGDR